GLVLAGGGRLRVDYGPRLLDQGLLRRLLLVDGRQVVLLPVVGPLLREVRRGVPGIEEVQLLAVGRLVLAEAPPDRRRRRGHAESRREPQDVVDLAEGLVRSGRGQQKRMEPGVVLDLRFLRRRSDAHQQKEDFLHGHGTPRAVVPCYRTSFTATPNEPPL